MDNADPKGLGRIRVTVAGILDEPSPWAPMLTLGGGSPQRGSFAVPDKGADVGILFHRGDPERPYYVGGHPGEPAGGTEVPEGVKAVEEPGERHKVKAFDTKAWTISADDREGKEKLTLAHKHLNLRFELDAKKGTLAIEGESALSIKCTGAVDVDSPQITIGGRVLLQNGKPIG